MAEFTKSIESLSISSTLPALKLLTRTKTSLDIYEITKTADNNTSANPTDSKINVLIDKPIEQTPKYSHNGRYLAIVLGTAHSTLHVIDTNNLSICLSLNINEIGSIPEFSPLDNFIISWSQFRSNKTNDKNVDGNLKIFHIPSGQLITSFSHKIYKSDIIQFSSDERLLFHIVTNEIQIYRIDKDLDSNNLSITLLTRLIDKGITQFKLPSYLSTNQTIDPLYHLSIATFIPEIGGKPAHSSIYRLDISKIDNQTDNEIVKMNSRSMFAASEAKLLWNSQGTRLLILTSTDVDRSNTSYYGSSQLFHLSTDGKYEGIIIMKKEGSIHDVQWAPSGDKYVVIAGAMPAQCTLFDSNNQPLYEFGYLHRNTISWSPHSRFLVLAGFGNLAGEVDFYDILRLRKLGSNLAHCSITYGWSPDSTYFMVGTTTPRMNVDNCFKIFKHNSLGPLIIKPIDVLFDVCWQSASLSTYPSRGISPLPKDKQSNAIVGTETKTTASAPYRPPGSTGELSSRLKQESGFTGKVGNNANVTGNKVAAPTPVTKSIRKIPGMPDPIPSTNAKKVEGNKAKRSSATQKSSNELTKPQANAQSKPILQTPPQQSTQLSTELSNEEKEKKVKTIKKKLKQISELKEKLAVGNVSPDVDQLNKLNSEKILLDELNSLIS